jgi:alpha/beta superfamily hydrolase
MVLKGQFLERSTVIPVGRVAMEGLWHRGTRAPALLVVPPTPDEGGSMDHVVAAELCWAAARAQHPTLRFNFRGVGASQGKRGGPESWVKDVEAAEQTLLESAAGTRVVHAALGSAANVLLRPHRGPEAGTLAGICLINPKGLDVKRLARVSAPSLILLGSDAPELLAAEVADAISGAGGTVELIDGLDEAFRRNLPQLGRTVAAWLDGHG